MIGPEQRAESEAEIRAAGAGWQMHLYRNTVDNFTNEPVTAANMPNAIRYNADADQRARPALQTLFTETLA